MELQKSTVLNSMLVGKVFRLTEVMATQKPEIEKKEQPKLENRILWPNPNKKIFLVTSDHSRSRDPLLQTSGPGSNFHTPKADNRFSFPNLYSNSFRRESHPTLQSTEKEKQYTLDTLKRELSSKGYFSKRPSKPDSRLNQSPSEYSETRFEDAPRVPERELLETIRRLHTVPTLGELEANPPQENRASSKKPVEPAQLVDVTQKPMRRQASKRSPAAVAEGSAHPSQAFAPRPAPSQRAGPQFVDVLPLPKTYCKDLGFRLQDLEVYQRVQQSPDSRRRDNLLKLKRSTSIELNSMLRVEKNSDESKQQDKQKSLREVQMDANISIMNHKPLLQRQQTLFELSPPPKPVTKWRLPEDSKLDLKIKCDASGRYYLEVDNPEEPKLSSTRERLQGMPKAETAHHKFDPQYFDTCQSIIDELKELKNMGCDDSVLADTITRDCAHDSNIMKLLFEKKKLRKHQLDDLFLLIRRGVKTDLSKVIIRYNLIYQGKSTRQYLNDIPKVTQAEIEKRREYRKRLALAEIKQEDRLALPKILSRLIKLKLRLQMNAIVEKVERIFKSEANKRNLEIVIDRYQSLHGAMSGAATEEQHMTAVKPLFSLEKKRREVSRLKEVSASYLNDIRELVEQIVEGKFRGTRKVIEKANELINFCLNGTDLAQVKRDEDFE